MDTGQCQLEIFLIDGFSVLGPDRRPCKLTSRKAKELLAFLACYPDQKFSRRELLSELYSFEDIGDPKTSLRKAIHEVRQKLNAGCPHGSGPLQSQDSQIWLSELVQVDLEQLRACWKASIQGDRPAEKLRHFRHAASIYSGPILRSFDWHWVEKVRNEASAQAASAAMDVSRAAFNLHQFDVASELARLAIDYDPLSEEATFLAIRAESNLGHVGAARDLYRRLEDTLLVHDGSIPSFEFAVVTESDATHALSDGEVSVESNIGVVNSKANSRVRPMRLGRFVAAISILLFLMGVTLISLKRDAVGSIAQAHAILAASATSPRLRAEACAFIAERAYTDLWSRNERYWIEEIGTLRQSFFDAAEWAIRNDPELAARIVGNGHRYFALISDIRDDSWKHLVDEAAASTHALQSTARARTLCGVAFIHWRDDPTRGYRAATDAAEISGALGSKKDLANALRHAGLCCADQNLRFRLYDRSLQIYRSTSDAPGAAMCIQSFSEANWKVERADECIKALDWALRSVKAFREVGNDRLVEGEIGYISDFVRQLPRKSRYASYRRAAHATLVSTAEDDLSRDEQRKGRLGLASALKIAFDLGDENLIAKDLGSILATTVSRSDSPTVPLLRDAYLHWCRKAKTPVDGRVAKLFALPNQASNLLLKTNAGYIGTPVQVTTAAQLFAAH